MSLSRNVGLTRVYLLLGEAEEANRVIPEFHAAMKVEEYLASLGKVVKL